MLKNKDHISPHREIGFSTNTQQSVAVNKSLRPMKITRECVIVKQEAQTNIVSGQASGGERHDLAGLLMQTCELKH